MPKIIKKEDLIQDILLVFEETKNTTRENYLKYGKYSRSPIKKYFGNWNNLLSYLGYDLNMFKGDILLLDKQDILDDLITIYEEHGKLTAELQRKHSKYKQRIIDVYFGSFNNVLKELGFNIHGRFITNEEIIKDVQELYKKHGYMSKQIIEDESIISHPTILSRFNCSFQEFCDTIGVELYTHSKNQSKFSLYVLEIISQILSETPKLEYTFNWLKNPNTNYPLRIDAYYPENNLAIEIDGAQHYKYTKFMHSTEEDFNKHIYRDLIKETLILENNINFVRITPDDNQNAIILKIKNAIK